MEVADVEAMRKRLSKLEAKIKWINDAHEASCNVLHNRAQRAENQLKIAKSKIAGLEMDARIAKR